MEGSRVTIPDLAAIRGRRGLSLDQISRSTRISAVYLTAIERGELQKLPGEFYARSYVRQYARAIPYDEQDLFDQFGIGEKDDVCTKDSPPNARFGRLLHQMAAILHLHGTSPAPDGPADLR